MLTLSLTGRIYLYSRPADMRKGINGLVGLVREVLQRDPNGGDAFVFINRRRDRLKVLQFDGQGFWLHYRVLEERTFERCPSETNADSVNMDLAQLAMLLSGISLAASTRRRNRYSLPRPPDQEALEALHTGNRPGVARN